MADFYERNNIARDRLENAASASVLLDNRSREIILRNAFNWMQDKRYWRGMLLSTWVGAMTGHGSGYSEQICRELGWDPNMIIDGRAELPRRAPTVEAPHES